MVPDGVLALASLPVPGQVCRKGHLTSRLAGVNLRCEPIVEDHVTATRSLPADRQLWGGRQGGTSACSSRGDEALGPGASRAAVAAAFPLMAAPCPHPGTSHVPATRLARPFVVAVLAIRKPHAARKPSALGGGKGHTTLCVSLALFSEPKADIGGVWSPS